MPTASLVGIAISRICRRMRRRGARKNRAVSPLPKGNFLWNWLTSPLMALGSDLAICYRQYVLPTFWQHDDVLHFKFENMSPHEYLRQPDVAAYLVFY
jgi:hypothetical protein